MLEHFRQFRHLYFMTQADQRRIVILEKNQCRRDYLRSIVSGKGYLPFIFEKETICLDNLISLQPDLVISGPLAHNRLYRFVHTVKMMNGRLPVLIISGDASLDDFASSNGFGDVKVLKINFEPAEIKGAISKLLRNRMTSTETDEQETPLVIGNSPAIREIKKRIPELNHLKEPVLIQGEPGTGKELIARVIHHKSEQRKSPFVKLQLAEMHPDLLDETILNVKKDGLQKSALQGAGAERWMAGGTLFLNEVAALPVTVQSRLLTIFEQGGFAPVAGSRNLNNNSDLTIIFSSSSMVDQLVSRGKFRKDLYYRMSVVSIEIPPLRERVDDIPLLADFFADKFCMEYGAGHFELPNKIKQSFCRYPWPGNVRELKAIVRRAVLYGEKDSVIQDLASQWAKSPGPLNYDNDIFALAGLSNLKKYLKEHESLTLKSVRGAFLLRTEKAVIKKALEKTNWNRKKAAQMLEISYKSLLNKIKEYELA
jgi:two-component system response regulator AtoC